MRIRPEIPGDAAQVAALVEMAFANTEHSDGTEAAIVQRLRDRGALTLSLVAIEDGDIVGHAAFSPVVIDGVDRGWYGLGPVAVRPDRQRQGIGGKLILNGLDRLRSLGARGCVVLGDPAYYRRFKFVADSRLRYPGAPAEYFQILPCDDDVPSGEVAYDPAFSG